MCLTWMLLCLFLRHSATQNPAHEGGKLPQTDEDTIDPVESIFIVITGKRARNRLGAMTERIQLKKVAINEIKLSVFTGPIFNLLSSCAYQRTSHNERLLSIYTTLSPVNKN